MAKPKHPMAAFMAGSLSLNEIFDRLQEDLANTGKPGAEPDTTFFDNPPAGLGFSGTLQAQLWVNKHVNSHKTRYNLGKNTNVFVTQIAPEKNVGNLAALIFAKQA